jgi:hypothetical protein
MDNPKTTEISFDSLYQQYVNASVNATNTTDMTDEEMLFAIELAKVEDILSDNPKYYDGVQRLIQKFLSKLLKLKDVFTATKANVIFDENSSQWNAFKDTMNSLHIDSLSFIGLSIVGHTLLFVLRVSRRVIYKYRVENVMSKNGADQTGLRKSLNDLFTYATSILKNIATIDTATKKKIKEIVEKANEYEKITKDPRPYLQKFLQEVDIMSKTNVKTEDDNVMKLKTRVPNTLINNVGVDETMMLLEKQLNIEEIFDKSSKGFANAVLFTQHLQQNILQKYQDLFKNDEINILFDEQNWSILQTHIKSVNVSQLSFSGLAVVGNILLFLLRTTRKIIFKYRLQRLEDEASTTIDSDAKSNLHKLWSYTSSTLTNLDDINFTTHSTSQTLIKQAQAFDDKIIDAVINDIPKNLANFKSLASNMLSLLNSFDTATDNEKKRKIAAAKNKGKIYLQRIQLVDAAKFINMYLGNSYQIPISNNINYEYLTKFLTTIENLNGLEKGIREKVTKRKDIADVIHQLKLLLYPSSELYFRCLELYEFLSGTIRIIVRRKYEDDSSKAKRSEQLYSGYDINLDHTNNTIEFQGVNDIYKTYFKNTSLVTDDKVNNMFGPFYDIFPNKRSDEPSQVAEDIVRDALQLDTLITMVTEHSTSIVLYSYGYSGSGKTFNFFGKIDTLEQSSYDKGLVWRLFRSLSAKKGVKVQLLKRIKLYGVLEPYMQTTDDVRKLEKGKFCFKDNVAVSAFNEKQDEENWAKTINKDLAVTLSNKLGFSKSTSNNKESSRGFYILKFEVSYNDKKSYIGVVDMAGNEDPYDIANAMIPTLDMSKFQNFLEGELIASVYDVVYQEIQQVVSNIVLIILLLIMLVDKLQYIPDDFKKLITNQDKDTYKQLNLLTEVYAKFNEIVNLKHKKDDKKDWMEKWILNNNSEIVNPKLADSSLLLNKQKTTLLVLDPSLCVVRWNRDDFELRFMVKEDLIKKILEQKIKTLESDKQIEYHKSASIADISAALKFGGSNSLQQVLLHKKLTLAYNELSKTGTQWNDVDITISASIKKLGIPENIDEYLFQNFQNGTLKPKAPIDKKHKAEINTINKTISEYFCDRKYLLQISNEVKVNYHYSQLCQIVKEGYYINKANAELIHFFQRKRNYQEPVIKISPSVKDTTENVLQGNSLQNTQVQNTTKTTCSKQSSSIKQNNKDIQAYDYEGNFDFKNYNKFAVQFPQTSTDTVRHYDTSLVKTLLSEFGDDNVRHIMFACVRDDKETDKIVGAISTLYLVQDLKST